mmetsp:Transcript_22667/g.53762  ORF Transcript_22667/g.53762 Transcript_22667/m.53762 type:complete len:1138 (-) Transcript_22667:139-3552(-)
MLRQTMIISDTTTTTAVSDSSCNDDDTLCTTPTTTATDIYPQHVTKGFFNEKTEEKIPRVNGITDENGARHPSHDARSLEAEPLPPSRPFFFRFLSFLFWNGPLLACWFLLLTSLFVGEVWNGPMQTLLERFKMREDYSDLGLYNDLDHELTYYHRRCDHRDISTHDANDLLIDPTMTLKDRQEIVLTHGAVVMKDILSPAVARELRKYLETRHHEFHSNNLELPWDELFWDGDGGNRLSLGLGPEDAPIVSRAIAEVGSNSQLKKTLEATLGKDPAVVEVSTLSTMHNADPQGIHTDSDYFGSSVLYTRSFLHSYTMFISLQNTTSRMGATTVCPGTHWCADEDLASLCQCNFLDDDEEEEDPIGYCNTFEASSNGQTGLDVGVLGEGDAMMFNQNIWHRGPRNYDEDRKENRVMFIMTFVTRRDYEKGDNRQQGWGTYYYMRHSMWGHLFSDLKTAASGGMDLFKRRIWKAYGLIGASRKGNLPWLEHWARQMANEMDFFADSELEDFQIMLRGFTAKNSLANWLFLDDAVMHNLFSEGSYHENNEIGWNAYINLLVESAIHQSKQLYFTAAMATALINGVTFTLYCIFWCILKWTQRDQKPSFSSLHPLQAGQDVSRNFKSVLAGHLVVLVIAAGLRHYVMYRAPLFERIHSNNIHFKAFPPLPFGMVNNDQEEDGEQFNEVLKPPDWLIMKEDRDRQEFRMKYPQHPHTDFYQEEYNRLENNGRTYGYSLPRTNSLLPPQPPNQASAFPERFDVLIGSRFDADFLASMNFVLDFHPGTKEWIKLMKEQQPSISKNPDKNHLGMAVDTIVSKILDTNDGFSPSLFSNEGGTPRRFLKQDHHTGWWIAMTKTEAKAITRRALLALAHPESVGVSYEHWKQVLAESRFGKHRETALAKKWIPQLVEKMTNDMFNEKTEHRMNVSPMPSVEMKRDFVTEERGRILLPSTSRGLLPKSMVTGKTNLSPSRFPLLPRSTSPFRVNLRDHMKGVVTLKIGDQIMYRGQDDQDLIYQATIVSIDAYENELEIQPLRNDDIHEEFDDLTIWVHIDDIQYYRPIQEGDSVWVLTEDPYSRRKSWKTYEVLFLTPFGKLELVLTPDYVEKYDDDEEYVEKVIQRDFKDALLIDNRIPEIRLRQY